MNRYDHHFRSLPPLIRANANQKVGYARGAILQHRANGFGPEDDEAIVSQFNLSGMKEFWDIELSEPMACEVLAHSLAVHFMVIEHKLDGTVEDQKASGPKAMQTIEIVKASVRAALRQARVDGEPWFMTVSEPQPNSKLDAKAWFGFVPSDTVVIPPEPQTDGIDLSKLKVRPRAAAEWMLAMPKRQHLLPPSLKTYLRPESPTPLAVMDRSGVPGRPTSIHLVEEEMNRRAAGGQTLGKMVDEAKALSTWLKNTHAGMPQLGFKRIQNALGTKFRMIPKSIPK